MTFMGGDVGEVPNHKATFWLKELRGDDVRLSFLGHRNYLLATFMRLFVLLVSRRLRSRKYFHSIAAASCLSYRVKFMWPLCDRQAFCQRRLLSRTFTFVLHFLWAIWSWPCETARSWRLFHSSARSNDPTCCNYTLTHNHQPLSFRWHK